MTNPRLQAIEQEILALAQQESEKYSGITGDWGRWLIWKWEAENDPKERLLIVQEILTTGYRGDGEGFYFDKGIEEKITNLAVEWGNILFSESELNQTREQLRESQGKISQLENEIATHLEALNTAQEWHERQKTELKEQHTRELQDLTQQLTQAKQKQQDYLTQEKSFLQREIKLIKEALHD